MQVRPGAESLTCRSSSHLLLWFESNGSHRHRRVTLFYLAQSRLRRFEQNYPRWLRSAASERRGFHSRGKPAASHAYALRDNPLGSAFSISIIGAPQYTPGGSLLDAPQYICDDSSDLQARGQPSAPHILALRRAPLVRLQHNHPRWLSIGRKRKPRRASIDGLCDAR